MEGKARVWNIVVEEGATQTSLMDRACHFSYVSAGNTNAPVGAPDLY